MTEETKSILFEVVVVIMIAFLIIYAFERYLIPIQRGEIELLEGISPFYDRAYIRGKAIKAKYPEFQAEVVALGDKMEQLDLILIPRKEIDSTHAEIRQLADEENLNVTYSRIKKRTAKDFYHEQTRELWAKGTQETLMGFLSRLEEQQFLAWVDGIRWDPSPMTLSKEASQQEFEIKIDVTVARQR
ncbi:hypothetical protein ACFLU6_09320 [Acidobacteriota bacterium]